VIEARLLERVYLGESWDYLVTPLASGLRLNAASPPREVFEVGDAVWLELDPLQMVAVA